MERERVRETERQRKRQGLGRERKEWRERRKGSFLGQQEEMLPPPLLSQRSPGTRACLSMVGQGRAVVPMDPPGPEQTCPSLFPGSSFQSPPYASPCGSPLSSPSLSTGPEYELIYPFDLPTSGGPALCYVGLWGEEACGPKDCLIAFAHTVPSFPVSLLLFSWSQLQSPLLQEAVPELPSLGPVPTLDSSSSWVPSFQPCLL